MVKSLSWLFESLKMNVAAEPMAGESNPIPAGNGIQGAQMEKYNRELLRAGILAWVNIIWRLSLEGRGRREVQVGQQEEFPHGKIWKDLEDFAAVPSAFALLLHPVLPHGQLGSARTRHWEGGCCPDPAWESLSPSSSSELVPIKWNHLCPMGRTLFTAVPQSY